MLLAVNNLTRLASGTPLLNDISLEIPNGEIISLVGSSGSGKSLLLRALALLDPISAGTFIWKDTPVVEQGIVTNPHFIPMFRSQVMYHHQMPVLKEGTVRESFVEPYRLKSHKDKTFSLSWVIDALEQLGRPRTFLEKDQQDLSGGERQIVSLIRTLQMRPELLLLDEPTASLDARTSLSIEEWIAFWQRKQQKNAPSILWVTHDRNQAERVSHRMLEMKAGRLSQVSGS